MSDINKVIIQGRIPTFKDAIREFNIEDEKRAVLFVKISNETSRKKDDGYYEQEMIDCRVFGKTAQNFAKIVKPGTYIVAEGNLVGSKPREGVVDDNGKQKYDQMYMRIVYFYFQRSERNGSNNYSENYTGNTNTNNKQQPQSSNVVKDPLADFMEDSSNKEFDFGDFM